AARAIARAVAQEPLLQPEAVLLELRGANGGQLRLDGEAQTAAIDLDRLLCGAAQQAKHRRAEVATPQVPERVVQIADGHHVVAGARMAVRAVHLIPDPLDRERILPEQQRAQRPEQNGQRLAVDGAIEPVDPATGADAHVVLRQRDGLRLGVGSIAVQRWPALGIEVRGLHLVLAMDAAAKLARPRQTQDLDLLDDEVGLPGRCRQRLAGSVRGGRLLTWCWCEISCLHGDVLAPVCSRVARVYAGRLELRQVRRLWSALRHFCPFRPFAKCLSRRAVLCWRWSRAGTSMWGSGAVGKPAAIRVHFARARRADADVEHHGM